MTVNVRMFVTDAVVTAPVTSGGGLSYDSIQLMKFPYIGRALLQPDTNTPATSDPVVSANRESRLLFVQVDPGKAVYYELTPAGRSPIVADANSPIMRGDNMLNFGPGWVLSVLAVS